MASQKQYVRYFDLAVPEKFSAEKEPTIVRAQSIGILEKYSKFLAKEEEVKEKQEKTRLLRDKLSLSLRIKNKQQKMRELQSPKMDGQTTVMSGSLSPTQTRRNILKSRNELFTRTWSAKEMKEQTKFRDLSMEEFKQIMENKVHSVPTTPVGEAPTPEERKLDTYAEDDKTKRKNPEETHCAGIEVSLILQSRKKEANVKHNKRAEKVRALERDCLRAQKIIEKLKSVSSTCPRLDN